MTAKDHRLKAKLKDKDFKLSALLEITQAINENENTLTLLERYRGVLCEALSIQKLALYTLDKTWKCVLSVGIDGHVEEITDESFFEAERPRLSISGDVGQEAFDIVIPVRHNDAPLAYLLVGDLDEDDIGMSPAVKHMNFITTITNVIIVAVRNRQLLKEYLHQERVRKELELAAEMQAMLVPTDLPRNGKYDFAAHYRPHQQVGGDYYDVVMLPNDEVMFCVADVSGKGVSAAFLMANFQANLRSIFKYREMDLREVVRELNERVVKSAMGEKYITLFLAVYNPRSKKLRYINCGHNPPILLHEDGKSEELKLGSIGLGMFDKIPSIDEGEVPISSQDLLLCYTDGLTEVENSQKEEFGPERVTRCMEEFRTAEIDQLMTAIMSQLETFMGESPFVDDTALLGCRFH